MKVGHTGITWGYPGDLEQAYRDVAELGYLGFETFSKVIMEWNKEKPGGYRALVDRIGLPTVAGYCYKNWIDSDTAEKDLQEAKAEADALRALPGSETLVLQAGPRPQGGYGQDEFRRLADAFNEIGRHCKEIGLRASIHPHTGTAVETREDIDTILSLVDPDLVGFAPDTGQIAKGGGDVLEVMRAHIDRISHVHLKDWAGPQAADADGKEVDVTGYGNYQPIGHGILPMKEILDVLIEASFDGWINVELDGTSRAPRPPREAAAMSRRYLGEALGDRVAWR